MTSVLGSLSQFDCICFALFLSPLSVVSGIACAPPEQAHTYTNGQNRLEHRFHPPLLFVNTYMCCCLRFVIVTQIN